VPILNQTNPGKSSVIFTTRSSKWSLSNKSPNQSTARTSLLYHMRHMPCLAHPPGLDFRWKTRLTRQASIPRVYWQIVSFKLAHHVTTRYHTKTKTGPLFEVVQETQKDWRNTGDACSKASRILYEPRSLARDWECHLFRCCSMSAQCVATKGTSSIYNVSVLYTR